MDNNLWLFDYEQGQKYEEFSKCEDYYGVIFEYILKNCVLSGKSILEIGAGSGKFTSFLADNAKSVCAVERSESLIEINKKKNKHKNILFILDDVKNIILLPESIDLIFAGWSFTSMRDVYSSILPMFAKSLKPNGKMILIENAGNDQFCKLVGIEKFTYEMKEVFMMMGFDERAVLNTIIKLNKKSDFLGAFPQFAGMLPKNLEISHRVSIFEADKEALIKNLNN